MMNYPCRIFGLVSIEYTGDEW